MNVVPVRLQVVSLCSCGWSEELSTDENEANCYSETIEDALRRAALHSAASTNEECAHGSRVEYGVIKSLYNKTLEPQL